MIYRNNSRAVKTFYGVTFAPGDIKKVKGYINDPKFVKQDRLPKEPPKVSEKKAELAKNINKEDAKEEADKAN